MLKEDLFETTKEERCLSCSYVVATFQLPTMPPPPSPSTTAQTGAPPAPPTAEHHESVKSFASPKHVSSYSSGGTEPLPPHQNHQRFVFADPVALRYLEEDPSTTVLHRRTKLQGYEVYIVEQWACSRIHPTFIITTYTGDPSHTAVVGILSVPTDESTWSPRLKLYFNAVSKCHARRKETPLGALMVTDFGAFPSALTVIPIPGGDLKKNRENFIVNEDLKRLGCAGRAGFKLQPPPPATEAKFYLLYRTSERVPLYSAVMELVKQCQIALVMFDKLAPEYVDGLLCDVTERAINDWWTDIGIDLYNIEPSDGVLGPTTVAALLGTFLGARNRLQAFGAPVAKDAFDIHYLKKGVKSFQKSQKMEKTRRLDRQTLDRLHRVTAKAANAEGWTDAVKSTMAELSGQGGEMVMGMARGRDKAGIAEIETLDIDNFSHLVKGERAKWLWRGKPRKSGIDDGFEAGQPAADMMFTTDDRGRYVWTSRRRRSNEEANADRPIPISEQRYLKPHELAGLPDERDQNLSKMVFKGVSDKVSDARIGFGRFKDAVGLPNLRSHHHIRPMNDLVGDAAYFSEIDSDTEEADVKGLANEDQTNDARIRAQQIDSPADSVRSKPSEPKPPEIRVEPVASNQGPESPQKAPMSRSNDDELDLTLSKSHSTEESREREQQQIPHHVLMQLRRPQSCAALGKEEDFERKDEYWPRHLSFSTVEEVILGWEGVGGRIPAKDDIKTTHEEAIAEEDTRASDARLFCSRVLDLDQNTVPWVEKQVGSVDGLNRILYDRHENINSVYLERLADYQQLRERYADILTDEHTYLTDHMKQVELLGAKLDYELNVLGSKVEEVETGVGEFERHVSEMETRVKTLIQGEKEKQSNSWLSWFGRVAGFSTR